MKSKIILSALFAAAIALGVTLYAHNVDTAPTAGDLATLNAIPALRAYQNQTPADFEQELAVIVGVQKAVLETAPLHKPILFGQTREPADLLSAGYGQCFDRSRVIEKFLKLLGFQTRHLSIYSLKETGSTVEALATPQVDSHAVSEVLTSRGWMLVDSNFRWFGLTADGTPVSAEDIQKQGHAIQWSDTIPAPLSDIFRSPFVIVYGLYSRHGMFYPPFTPVPDINWTEFLYNVSERL